MASSFNCQGNPCLFLCRCCLVPGVPGGVWTPPLGHGYCPSVISMETLQNHQQITALAASTFNARQLAFVCFVLFFSFALGQVAIPNTLFLWTVNESIGSHRVDKL